GVQTCALPICRGVLAGPETRSARLGGALGAVLSHTSPDVDGACVGTTYRPMSGHVAPTPTREGLSGDVHRHGVRFYEEDASLCAAVAEVIARGLRAGEAVLVIGTREHRSAFLDRVDGPDVAA